MDGSQRKFVIYQTVMTVVQPKCENVSKFGAIQRFEILYI
ncbi:hypothetical protein GCM10028812_53950 [Ancylobacter sonchi]